MRQSKIDRQGKRPLALLLHAMLLAGALLFAPNMVPNAHAAGPTQVFCSHPAPAYKKAVTTFTSSGQGQSRIIDAKVILNAVILKLQGLNAWEDSFKAIKDDSGFKQTLGAAVLLYAVIFGIMMVFNMLQLSWFEVFMRILRVAAVFYLIFGTGMSEIIAKFIMGGMNQLIDAYYDATIGTFNVTLATTPQDMLTVKPLMFLITPMEKVMNLQFICSVLAFMFAGPAGAGLALFLIMGIFSFFMTIVAAIATYVKAIIGLSILFALAPIFIACLLFENTRRLFDGWLSMCLNFALQPVFVFAFLGFFMVMLDGALQPLTNIHWCYGPMWDLNFVKINFYYPVPPQFFEVVPPYTTVQYDLPLPRWDGKPGEVALGPEYGRVVKDLWRAAGLDLYVVDVLMFTMLSTLTWRYSDYTGQIASEIVGGGVSITVTGGQMMQQLKSSGMDPQSLVNRVKGGVSEVAKNVSETVNSSDTVKTLTGAANQIKGDRK